jgi:hypothetical protein
MRFPMHAAPPAQPRPQEEMMSMGETMGQPIMPANSDNREADEEFEEITVDITEDNMVWLHGEEWEIVLAPEEARELAAALREAADDAEGPTE